MELIQGIESRRSIRGFKNTPVTEDTLRKILHAASRSPSYTNTQPWEVAVVTGKKRDELSKILHELANSGVAGKPDMPTQGTWPPESTSNAVPTTWSTAFRLTGQAWRLCWRSRPQ